MPKNLTQKQLRDPCPHPLATRAAVQQLGATPVRNETWEGEAGTVYKDRAGKLYFVVHQ